MKLLEVALGRVGRLRNPASRRRETIILRGTMLDSFKTLGIFTMLFYPLIVGYYCHCAPPRRSLVAEKAVNSEQASSESQKATLPVRLSRDFRLSVPSTTGSVRREDFSLYAGSFAEGFTILFPFCLIKSRGGEDDVAYPGETVFEASGGDELE
jgi:hypothetical protein